MRDFNYTVNDQSFQGKWALPEKIYPTAVPAALIFHDWSGCNRMTTDYAEAITKLGYAGIAVDMYGRGRVEETNDAKMALMKPLLNDRSHLLSISKAAIEAAKNLHDIDANKIAIIGFCFGGLCVLDVARSGADLRGAVSFHGALHASEAVPATGIKTSVMVLHGDSDKSVPFSDIAQLRDELNIAKAEWQNGRMADDDIFAYPPRVHES